MSKLINKYLIAIISFYIFWLGLLPLFLTKTVSVLCNNFSHNSNYEINIQNPKVKLYFIPVIKFKADEIYIKNKSSIDLLKADDLYIKIRLLPLLSGKVHINNFSVDNLCLVKKVKKDSILNKNFFKNLEKTNFIFDSISIDKLISKFLSEDNEDKIIYTGKNIKFNKKNRYLSLNIDSKLATNKIASKIYINLFLPKDNTINNTRFDIDISNLDIEPLGEFFKNFLPAEIEGLCGKINITANNNELKTNLDNFKVLNKDKVYSIIFPQSTDIISKFDIKQNLIDIRSAEVSSKNIHVGLSGKIKDYLGKLPSVDLKVIINKSRTEDFVNLLPPFKVDDLDGYKLKKYKFYGDVIGNLSLTGKLPEPNINGKLFIDNGILIKPIPNAPKGATIKLNFTGKHVNYDVNVPAGGQQRVWVNGVQELYNVKYAEIIIKSTPNVNLHSAEDVVNPLHEIFNFVIGPVPILDVYGTGNIDLTVKGTREIPHAWGGLNFYNTKVNFEEIPDLKLENADAVLIFNDTSAVFKTNKGLVNNQDFKISGTCNLYGNFDFDVSSNNQPINNLYHAIETSTMIDDVKQMVPKVDKISGLSDLNLKIYGNVKKIEDLKFNKNAFAKGKLHLKNNEIAVRGMNINKVNAEINVDGTAASSVINAYIANSPLNVSAKIKDNIANLTVNIPKINLNSIMEKETDYLPYVSLNAKYKGDINDIEFENLRLNSKIIPQKTNSIFKYNSGEFNLDNSKLTVKNFDLYIKNPENRLRADLQVAETFSKKPVVNGAILTKISDLKLLNELFGKKILPAKINEILQDYEFQNGAINLNSRFNDNKLSTETTLSGIKFTYLPQELPIEIINGKLVVRNNDLKLQSINLLADNMPILLDGEIKDIVNKRYFNIYINSKPKQDFIDKFLNKNLIYPIKIKGDIIFNALLKGYPDSYDISSKVNMEKDASIYYYGATVGDIENAIVLNLDSKINNKKEIKIKDFIYDKIIDSQSGKQTSLNMLKVRGGINFLSNDIEFRDLYIKTSHPTDAKIFNIIFGKPNIKQGQFNSDLKLQGRLSNPRIIGDFHIVETEIPFLDTTMKNIEMEFKDKVIEIHSKGEVLGNDISVEATLKNKLTKPYYIEKALLSTTDINLNKIVNKLKSVAAENAQPQDTVGAFDINSIIAKNLKLKADNIILRNIHATNFEAETGFSEQQVFEIKNFMFDIANGHLDGNYSYNLKNNDLKLNMNAKDISANDITMAVFDLQNQIHGDLTGQINISCKGENYEKCMQTLNGSTVFNVKDGRMPKLGSLEYLLKAGNLVKGGITSLSINGVIDLITPMKTGNFSDIYGFISIKDGIADDIEITTQGKNLSLFISGTYNFATSIADMEVLGMISRKISTMLGPIGNVSVNTLFNLIPGIDLSKNSDILENINKIPGIEITNKAYRKFMAIIKGNINGDDYVTSFKWIN